MENITGPAGGVPEALPEPVPEWRLAKKKWDLAWQFHTYGFGVVYVMLSAYCVIVLVQLHRRLRVQQYIFIINGILLILSVCRSLYLLLDPYESVGRVPVPLLRVMYGVAYPCLTSSFSLVQMVVMRITKVRMGPQNFHNYRVLAAVITTHFTVVIVIDVTVAYKNGLKLLILVCQSVFITWGLVLCFGFIYNGFKIAQFTNEANRALKQLITYWKVKQETLKNGNRKELALHRINKPRIRSDYEEKWLNTEDCPTSDLDSSDSLSFYNEAHLEFTEDALAKIYENRLKKSFRRIKQNSKSKNGSPTKLRLTSPTSNLDFSSDSGDIPETPSTYGPVSTEERFMTSSTYGPVSTEERFMTSATLGPVPVSTDERLNMTSAKYGPSSREGCMTSVVSMENKPMTQIDLPANAKDKRMTSPKYEPVSTHDSYLTGCAETDVFTVVSTRTSSVLDRSTVDPCDTCFQDGPDDNHAYINPAFEFLCNGRAGQIEESGTEHIQLQVHTECPVDSAAVSETGHCSAAQIQCEGQGDLQPQAQESGYMADTEHTSPKPHKKKSKTNHRLSITDRTELDPDGSPRHEPYPLPASDGSLGLYRIRQGRMLRKVLRVTYMTTLFGFVCCVLQLYAMFGVYGVLSNEIPAEPWPWLLFQSATRIVELMMAATMAYSIHTLGGQRCRPPRRKHRKPKETQSVC